MKRVRLLLRRLKCWLLIKHYRLRHARSTAYIAYGSDISRDLVVGDYAYIGYGAIIGPKVSIGDYTMFGPRVLCVGDDHRYDIPGVPAIFASRPILRPTKIGKDVWIGAGATILAGVEIGDGAIIATGSVVTRSIPACEVHGGVPNRKLKERFQSSAERDRHLEFLKNPPQAGEFPIARV